MNRLTSRLAFESASATENFLIKFGRHAVTKNRIYLPGQFFKGQGENYADRHKGHVLCGDDKCTAHIGVKSPRKGSKGAQEHWYTLPGEKHRDNCTMRKLAPGMAKGAVLDLTDFFIGISKKSMKLAPSPVGVTDEALQGLDRIKVPDAQFLVNFLKTKSPDYINNSYVTLGDYRAPIRFFLTYYQKSERKRDVDLRFKLFTGAMANQGYAPIFMELIPEREYTLGQLMANSCVLSKKIVPIKEPLKAKLPPIQPCVFIDTKDLFVRTQFGEQRRYLVLALAKIQVGNHGDYLLNIQITDPRQIQAVHLGDIIAENERNQRVKLIPEPKPA